MAKTAAIAGPTSVIRVVPDEKAPVPEPLVLLTERDLTAPGVPANIVWRKLPASKSFKMVDLEDLSGKDVFQNIVKSNKKIECDFVPPPADPAKTEYKYRLTIKYKGTEYDSDARGGPTHGRPVIRN